MARWQPIQIVGGSYADDTLPWTHQDTINYIPVPAEKEGVRSRAILRCAPGFSAFCDLGTNAPIRGARNVEGRLFVVSGTTLFQVNADGSSTERGTIPGVKRCSLSHNQITGGNEVVISNAQGGYVYNTKANTLEQITDEAFSGSICFDSLDSYILGIEPARRFAFTSDLADATSYSTLDQYEAEGSPDLLVGQAVTHREWWLMGERTIEPFLNTGAATGTFQRAQGTVIEVGLAATHAVAVMDNSVFWLGSDGIVYRANGYTPQRISTHAIEQAIARCNTAQAFAFTFEDSGHKVFYLTFPDGQTWGYDAATGEWHRRKSQNLDRWRINTLTRWNGKWIAGDFSNGKLYQLDWKVQREDDAVLERRRITGVTHDHQNALIINGLELVVDTGVDGGSLVQPDVLTITGNLPDSAIAETVSFQYTISATHRPAVATISAGSLPTGLTMNAGGLVSGTVTNGGNYSWTVLVTDSEGSTVTRDDSCTVTVTGVATWEPMTLPTSGALSTDKNTLTASAATTGSVYAAQPIRAKTYFEAQIATTAANQAYAGVGTGSYNRRSGGLGNATGTDAVAVAGFNGSVLSNAVSLGTLSGGTGTSIRARFAVDPTTRKVWIGAVGMTGWVGGGDPVAGTTPTFTVPGSGLLWPAASIANIAGSVTLVADPTQFTGTAPTGFVAGLYASADSGFTTLDPDSTSSAYTLSNGNLTAVSTGTTTTAFWAVSTRIKRSGKAYWEVTAKSGVTSQARANWGICREGSDYLRYFNPAIFTRGYAIGSDGTKWDGTTNSSLTTGISTDDVLRFRFDIGSGLLEVAVNGGSWLTLGSGITGGGWRVAMQTYEGTYFPEGGTFNFGQNAFAYSVPTGYDAGWLAD